MIDPAPIEKCAKASRLPRTGGG